MLVFLPGKYIGGNLFFHRRDPNLSSYLVNILEEPCSSTGGIHTYLPTWFFHLYLSSFLVNVFEGQCTMSHFSVYMAPYRNV